MARAEDRVMRINDEKRQAVVEKLAKMQRPSVRALQALAKAHGVSYSTVRNWRAQLMPRRSPDLVSVPAIPPLVSVPAIPPGVSPPPQEKGASTRSLLIRNLSSQVLFIAEQLEILAAQE